MEWKKISVTICFWCIMATMWAQAPTLLTKGKADSQECKEWVETRLQGMNLKEKIGQLFIHTVAPQDTEPNRRNIRNAVKEYKVGGLLFSGGQLSTQVVLTNFAQEMAETPLLMTFDGEWGLAMRLKGTPSFPKNRVLGCIQDNELLYEYGLEVARQCREIGVHVNFAPVADVDNNPLNPVINTRSFGGDPRNVADKVIAYSRGLEEGGVLSVSKHFPGHGDTNVDSHKALPVLNFSRERMDSIELYPFRQAIQAGLGGIMVGHLEVPAFSKKPASISTEILSLLQDELGFKGLAFTDALEMKGISNNANLCAQTLIAGNDMLLAPRNLKRELDGVLNAVKNGQLTEEQITEKCRKVLTFKYALGLHQRQFVQLSGLEQRLNHPGVQQLMDRLEKAAVTVVSNDGGILPLDVDQKKVAVLNIGMPAKGKAFCNQLKKYMQVDCIQAHPDSITSISKRLGNYEKVIVAIHTEKYAAYQSMLNTLSARLPLVYVYLTPMKRIYNKGNNWKKAAAVVMGHSGSVAVQHFVADVLMGREKATGRLSVEVKDYRKPGEGVVVDLKTTKVYRPEDYGMNADVLARIDEIALEGIKAKAYPGCQILILKDGAPVYDKCFGTFTYGDSRKVTSDDIYDIASLTKTTATLLAVMKLYDQGKFGLTDPISKYVPVLQGSPKGRITIEDLLYHQSGLPGSWPFYREAINDSSYTGAFFKARLDANHHQQVDRRLYVVDEFKYKDEYVSLLRSEEYPLQVAEGVFVNPAFPERILEMIASDEIPLRDRRYRYSCLNFVLLKEMVEQISGMPMDKYLDQEFYAPMGMQHTLYSPLSRFKPEQIVPTVQKDYLRGRKELRGYVHDEIAAFMGGVSGNAGLFSNAHDVGKVYQMLAEMGQYDGKRYLSLETCQLFMNRKSRLSRRGLGFDKPDAAPGKGPCADEAPLEVVGHTGFTGTCAWTDAKNGLVFVFLSNRIYPRPFDHKALMSLNIRPRIQQVMYQALMK
ncbi:MAG: serine hydrolase [Bacteroidaceae bacterium]|nr:serine hydrolase [Bacteroidaceae bacterium]